MLRLSVLIALLSLFAVSAFAQQADTTATAEKQQADTTVAAVKQPAAPAAVVAPVVAPMQTAPPQTTPPPTTTAQSSDSGKSRRLKLGVGVHYMETVGDIKDAEGFDSGALNFLLGSEDGFGSYHDRGRLGMGPRLRRFGPYALAAPGLRAGGPPADLCGSGDRSRILEPRVVRSSDL